MKFLLGKKIEMSQRFREDGLVLPVTLISVEPCVVTQVKTKEVDGYNSVQIGFGKRKKLNKPLSGHLKNLPPVEYMREIPIAEAIHKRGDILTVEQFKPGDLVDITGISKGRGFQGVVKRHRFRGGPASHGHKDNLRMPGSIGSIGVQRVFKGTRMAGRMGGEKITIKNLEVVEVDAKKNLLVVKGGVPGARGAILIIKSAKGIWGDLAKEQKKESN